MVRGGPPEPQKYQAMTTARQAATAHVMYFFFLDIVHFTPPEGWQSPAGKTRSQERAPPKPKTA